MILFIKYEHNRHTLNKLILICASTTHEMNLFNSMHRNKVAQAFSTKTLGNYRSFVN